MEWTELEFEGDFNLSVEYTGEGSATVRLSRASGTGLTLKVTHPDGEIQKEEVIKNFFGSVSFSMSSIDDLVSQVRAARKAQLREEKEDDTRIELEKVSPIG